MAKQLTKTLYLHGKGETAKDGKARELKILRVQKKMGGKTTESQAVRLMIDSFNEK